VSVEAEDLEVLDRTAGALDMSPPFDERGTTAVGAGDDLVVVGIDLDPAARLRHPRAGSGACHGLSACR